jgi:NADH:ubiquinone oxidoreductase subunit 5 (subunit L)/multisubunit Na+/H+ antiporter MnhA subunit
VPLFAGFVSKEAVLAGVWSGGFVAPFAMLLFAAFLTAFYMARVTILVFSDRGGRSELRGSEIPGSRSASLEPRNSHLDRAHDPGPVMMLPLWILALITWVMGVVYSIRPPHLDPEVHAPGWAPPLAIAVAFGGILLAWLTYKRGAIDPETLARAFAPVRHAALRKFWLDDLYGGLYRYLLLAFARVVGWLDRYVVDGVLNVVSAWTLDGGDALRRMQTGKVQDYVFALGFGLLALMVWIGVDW